MRARLLAMLSAAVVTLATAGCATTRSGGASVSDAPAMHGRDLPSRPALINHFVEFKLSDPAGADELIADCDRYLGRIPGVVSYFAGKPHDIGRGDRVYSDYHVGFFVGFDSDEDYRVYIDHPHHLMVVEKWRPRLERLRVFDVRDDGLRPVR